MISNFLKANNGQFFEDWRQKEVFVQYSSYGSALSGIMLI